MSCLLLKSSSSRRSIAYWGRFYKMIHKRTTRTYMSWIHCSSTNNIAPSNSLGCFSTNKVVSKSNFKKHNIDNLKNSNSTEDVTSKITVTETSPIENMIISRYFKLSKEISITDIKVINEEICNNFFPKDDFVSAAKIILTLNPLDKKNLLPESTCQKILHTLIDNYSWNYGFVTILYMLLADYELIHIPKQNVLKSSSEGAVRNPVYFIMSGLMSNEKGMEKAIELFCLIAFKKRSDALESFSYSKVTRYSQYIYSHQKNITTSKLLELLEMIGKEIVRGIEVGWISYTLNKATVAIACSSNFADFGSISQGDGVSIRTSLFNAHLEYSFVTPQLLSDSMKALNYLIEVDKIHTKPMQCVSFLNFYWISAYRLRNFHLDMNYNNDQSQFGINIYDIKRTKIELYEVFNSLVAFLKDQNRYSQIAAGYKRRLFRILCDEIGLHYKINKYSSVDHKKMNTLLYENPSSTIPPDYVLCVWKSEDNNYFYNLKSQLLTEILRSDQLKQFHERKYDNRPLFWRHLKLLLDKVDDKDLPTIIHRHLNAMVSFSSPSWGLLLIQELREREIPLPLGILRTMIKMCAKRNDNYGLLEIMHMSNEESSIAYKNKLYHKKLHQIREKDAQFDDFDFVMNYEKPAVDDMNEDSFQNKDDNPHKIKGNIIEKLNNFDWNRALLIIYRSKYNVALPDHTYRESITETMTLMRDCGKELDRYSMSTFLRFLVQKNNNKELLERMMNRFYVDKALPITYIECTAVSSYILYNLINQDNFKKQKDIQMSKPLYSSENYLVVTKVGMHK
eukprot:gene16004-21718_t